MTYAMLEGRPVILLTPLVAYWLVKGKWFRMHPADATQASYPCGGWSAADFDKIFGQLPPLRLDAPPLPTDRRFRRD